MTKKYNLLLLLLFVCYAGNLFAQTGASTYGFAQSTGTYTAITGTTSTATGDDGTQNGLSIGFTFNFGGTAYTNFCVTTNGFLKLGTSGTTINTGTANYTNGFGAAVNQPLIAGFWDDNSVGSTGNIQYLTQGSPGSQTLTVQWTNMSIANTGGSAPYMSFQIVLHETTDEIEIVYDSMTATTSSTGAIGIESASGDYMSVTPVASGTATTSTTTANNSISLSNTALLPTGLTYTFTPPGPCSGTPTAGTAVSTASPACPNQSYTVSLSGSTAATGLIYDWQASPVGLNTWSSLSVTTATYTTTMTIGGDMDYRCVVSCGSFYDTSSVVTVTSGNFYTCYCSPLNGTTLSPYPGTNYITSVDIPTTTLNNPTTSAGSGGYTQYSPTVSNYTDTFYPGITYTLNVGMYYPQYDDAGAWIDWDMDGLMDNTTEFITLTNNGTTGASGTFTVPLTAIAGMTGLRVRVNDWGYTYGGSNTGSCGSDGAGETEDYVITIGTLTACTGQPSATTATGPSAICPSSDFTLVANNMSVGLGIAYDWQYDDGAGWVSTGGTGTTYTVTGGITVPTSYRMITYCSGSNLYDTSNVLAVAVNNFYECYCSPLNGTALSSYTGTNYVTSVDISTTTLNNVTTTAGTNGYSYYSPSTSTNTATLSPGVTYTLNVGMYYPSYDDAGAWIDWDMDGTLDNTTEFISLTNNGTTGASGTFTVPLTATAGMTGLRVRVNDWGYTYGGSNTGSCGNDGAGETEDYAITIAALTACAGQPAATTITGPSAICPSINFTLSAANMTVGLGVTYDWQYDDGAGWISTGGTSTTYTATGGILLPTSYRMITYCANSNLYDTSNTLAVAVNNFYECYCSPLNGTTLAQYYYGTNYVTSVDIPTTTLNNVTTTGGTNAYGYYSPSTSTNTATLSPGITYTLNVGMYYPSYDDAGAWIDWDMDGVFDNTTEFISLTNNGTTGASGTFTVPLTATAGMTGLRVRVNDWGNTYGGTNTGPCADDYYGETEDYAITIAALTACAGQPAATTATGPSGVCPSLDFTVTASNMTVGLGVSYDWQYDDGAGWISTGGTSTTYTATGGILLPTSYRMITYCANSNLYDTSNTLAVAVNNFYACYCSPLNGTSLSMYGVYNGITSVVMAGTTLNNPTSSAGSGGYTQYIPTTTSTTCDLLQGVTYTLNVGMYYPTYDYAGAWIDWDQDGTLDNTTEFITLTNNNSTGASGTFTVPLTATLGMTGLRVRVNDWGNTYGGTNTGPCDDDYYGETEDYAINILTAPSCLPPTALSSANITANTADVSYTTTATQVQIEYGPSPLTQGTGTVVTTSLNPYTITLLSPSTTYDYYVRSICGVNDTSIWTMGTSFTTQCAAITGFPWTYDVETQPANSAAGALSQCWTATPTPAYVYSWWVSATGTTPSSSTGPLSAYSGTHFFYAEASYWTNTNDSAELSSPQYDVTALTTPTLTFYYHMYGATINKLIVEALSGSTWIAVDSLIGQQQTLQSDPFLSRSVVLTGITGVTQIRFTAVHGSSYTGDICLDNISISDGPLAIKLAKLTAVNVGASNRVEWTTYSEEESDKFYLQRSADGKTFETINSQTANGTASHYTYMDNSPIQGMNYYRLQMKEGNGNVNYSEVVKAYVNATGKFAVEAYPNPVTDLLTVRVSGSQGNDAQVQVTDITGKVIQTVKMGGSQVSINMHGLANGIYLIKYADADHTETMRVNKQ